MAGEMALEDVHDPPGGRCVLTPSSREGARDECEERPVDEGVAVDEKHAWPPRWGGGRSAGEGRVGHEALGQKAA